jgi:hypothetical protein
MHRQQTRLLMHTKLKATFPENSLGALYKKISSKTNGY